MGGVSKTGQSYVFPINSKMKTEQCRNPVFELQWEKQELPIKMGRKGNRLVVQIADFNQSVDIFDNNIGTASGNVFVLFKFF